MQCQPGVLIAGTNPVTTDAVATAVMGYDPHADQGTAPFVTCDNTLLLAEGHGIGTTDLKRIEVRGVPIAQAMYRLRRNRNGFLLSLFSRRLSRAQTRPTMFPQVRGTHEMVGAANNFEVEAGYRILTQGGNAVDAAVAAVLTAAVTEQSRFGLGGEMPMLVKMNGQPVIAISGVGIAPAQGHHRVLSTPQA